MRHREPDGRYRRATPDDVDDVRWTPSGPSLASARASPPTPATVVTKPLFDASVLALVELLFHRDKVVDDPANPFLVVYFSREQWGAARDALEVLRTIGFGPRPARYATEPPPSQPPAPEPAPEPPPPPAPDPVITINGVRYVPEVA